MESVVGHNGGGSGFDPPAASGGAADRPRKPLTIRLMLRPPQVLPPEAPALAPRTSSAIMSGLEGAPLTAAMLAAASPEVQQQVCIGDKPLESTFDTLPLCDFTQNSSLCNQI